MKKRWSWIFLGSILLAGIVIFAPASKRTLHDAWLPSTHNPGRLGYEGIYLTLAEKDWPVEQWSEPLSRLEGTNNILIIGRSPQGPVVPFKEEEGSLLNDWVLAGNTLFLLGNWQDWEDSANVLRALSIPAPIVPHNNVQPLVLSPVFDATPIATIALSSPLNLPQPIFIPKIESLPPFLPEGTQVLWSNQQLPYIVKIPHGKGQILWSASPSLLSNKWLPQSQNLAALLTLLQSPSLPQHIWFEETHNGFSSSYALTHLWAHSGFRFAGLLVLFGGFVFLGCSLLRFGEPRPLPKPAQRSYLEFIDSMADLYRRADLRNETILALYQETRQRVLFRLRLPDTASDEEISDRLLQAHPHLPKWKKLAHRFTTDEYTYGLPPSGWMLLARDLIEIKKTLA